MAWLLDTNVLSELRRPRPNQNVLDFFARNPVDAFYTSVSLAEIRFGIESVSDSAKQALLTGWLDRQIRPMFAGRILAVDEEILLRWRLLVEDGRRVGHTFSQPDLLIAATALRHGLTVATRDKGDFKRTGASLVNPWEPI
jgi:predicted nucleic acid-binding protein